MPFLDFEVGLPPNRLTDSPWVDTSVDWDRGPDTESYATSLPKNATHISLTDATPSFTPNSTLVGNSDCAETTHNVLFQKSSRQPPQPQQCCDSSSGLLKSIPPWSPEIDTSESPIKPLPQTPTRQRHQVPSTPDSESIAPRHIRQSPTSPTPSHRHNYLPHFAMAEAFLSSLGGSLGNSASISNAASAGALCETIEDLQLQLQAAVQRDCTPKRAKHIAVSFQFAPETIFDISDAEMGESFRGGGNELAALETVGMDRTVTASKAVMNQRNDDSGLQKMVVKHITARIGVVDGSRWALKDVTRGQQGWVFTYICAHGIQHWKQQVNDSEEKPVLAEYTHKNREPILANRPAYDCAGAMTITFSKPHCAIIVKYRHTPLHKTFDEILAYITPAPIASLPMTSSGRRKRAATSGLGADGQPLPEGITPKRPRKQRKSQATAAAAEPEENITPHVDEAEAARRREVATGLLVEAGIDPATLSEGQFSILSNQSPGLQQESIAMLKQYGAERLRIIYPTEENKEAPEAETTDTILKPKNKRGPQKSKVQALSEENVSADADTDPALSAEVIPAPLADTIPSVETVPTQIADVAHMEVSMTAPLAPMEPSQSTPVPEAAPTKRVSRPKCDECRVRRVKCSFECTGCFQCIKNGQICTYPTGPLRRGRPSKTKKQQEVQEAEEPSQLEDLSILPDTDIQESINEQMNRATDVDESALYHLSAHNNMDFMTTTESAIELAQHAIAIASPSNSVVDHHQYPDPSTVSLQHKETPVPVLVIPLPIPHVKSPVQHGQQPSTDNGRRGVMVHDYLSSAPQTAQPPHEDSAQPQDLAYRDALAQAWAESQARAEQEAARAQAQAEKEEAARLRARQEAEAEAARLKAQREAEAEATRVRAQKQAEAEAARVKAQQQAQAEAARKRAQMETEARVKAAAAAQARFRAQTQSPAPHYSPALQSAKPRQPSRASNAWGAAQSPAQSYRQSPQLPSATMNSQHQQQHHMQRQTSVTPQNYPAQPQPHNRTPLSNGHHHQFSVNQPVYGQPVSQRPPQDASKGYEYEQSSSGYYQSYNPSYSASSPRNQNSYQQSAAPHANPQQYGYQPGPGQVQAETRARPQQQQQQQQQSQQSQQQQHRQPQPVQTWYSSFGSNSQGSKYSGATGGENIMQGHSGHAYNPDEDALFEIIQATR